MPVYVKNVTLLQLHYFCSDGSASDFIRAIFMGNPASHDDNTKTPEHSVAIPLGTQPVLSIQAHSQIQKRALNYAATIQQLFAEIMAGKQPADRVLAHYFSIHKKHGSKDRKIIRETLFSLFRWWGWLKQLGDPQQPEIYFSTLSTCALLEAHPWQPVALAWHELSRSTTDYLTAQTFPVTLMHDKLALMHNLYPDLVFTDTALLPEWFWQICPIEAAQQSQLINAMSSRPPIWGRAQGISSQQAAATLQANGIDASHGHYFNDALNLGNKSMNLNAIDLYKAGKLEIQDLASQVIGHICAPKANEHWWDACSGAGGKTLQLRSLMLSQSASTEENGSITASDIRGHALEELRKRAKRANFKGISLARWQNETLPVPSAHFDGVLVDAPCSCTGTWRRNPDMRWLASEDTVNHSAQLQLDILTRSSQAVKIGGTLVYATCSLSPLENEQVVNAFLQQHPEFILQTVRHPFTGQATKMLTIWPFEANSDGMFVARMSRSYTQNQ